MNGVGTQVGMIAFVVIYLSGCANVRITDPSRTATEQFLLSQAVIQAVEPFSFDALMGRKVYLESEFFAANEKEFVLGEFRAKMLLSGIQIVNERENAEIVVEIRSGGVGIDRYESLLGLPALLMPSFASMATDTPMATLITPELAISKKVKQVSFASVAYVAYWADTGEVVASSGPSRGKTWREDWWFFGIGPRSVGNVPTVDHKTK